MIPGGSYSIIATDANKSQPTYFTWHVPDEIIHQKDLILPQLISFSPEAACTILELTVKPKESTGTLPIYLSINRTDDAKPPEPIQETSDQAEMVNLSTTGGVAASSLISNTLIGGNCFDVSNVTSFGNSTSRGTFTNGGTNIGIGNGVVLSTGNVGVLPGPNNQAGVYGGYSIVPTPDPDLAPLASGILFDLSKIEFDFRPTSPVVSFDFVFGSDEYCEFVDGGFNDVFGFFISGPGIAGNQNIAVIPSTSTVVSIDNVSHVTN